jgi:putative methionine-R-sulfoxide reductase with GAF domain
MANAVGITGRACSEDAGLSRISSNASRSQRILFSEKAADFVGLYLRRDRALVLSVDS